MESIKQYILVPYRKIYGTSMSWPLINILKLHHPEDTEKSSVRALGDLKLNKIFDELCRAYVEKNSISYKALAREIFKVNKSSLQNWRGFNTNYKDGHPIPLWALDKILELNGLKRTEKHTEVIKSIQYVQCGRVSYKLKAQIYLTPELARLCGAHAADGSLSAVKNRGPVSARWDLGDQEKENVLEARNWIKSSFDFDPILMQKGNMSYTRSNKQILSRYLTQIFDFPIGEKSNIVKIPKILLGKDDRILSRIEEKIYMKLQLEFAKEVINFDGHSTLSGGVVQAGLGSNSKQLLEDVRNIFLIAGINFHIYDNKILTTSFKESKKLYSIGLFRGQKRKKFEKLILQHARKTEKKG